MSYPGFPLVPPFAVTASYQTKQYGSGNLYTPGVPSVYDALVSPPTSGTTAETAADTTAHAKGFSAYSAANAVQTVTVTGSPTGGTFELEWAGEVTTALAYNATSAQVQTALNQLVPAVLGRTGTNEAQTVTITGTPTGGTFTLTYAGQTTAAIAYNASAATVQTALTNLSNIGFGDVAVTGGPGPGTPYVVTFQGALHAEDVAQMTATGSFTGGTTPAIAVTTTTAGVTTPDITVTGSNGGPFTVTFTNLLGDEPIAEMTVAANNLTGGTNPDVTVAVTTAGTAAFVNEALQDAHRNRDAMRDFYDQAAGMHF